VVGYILRWFTRPQMVTHCFQSLLRLYFYVLLLNARGPNGSKWVVIVIVYTVTLMFRGHRLDHVETNYTL